MTKSIAALLLFITLSGFAQTKKSAFEKIIYHTTACFGTCPTYHLEVNKDKTVRLYAEQVFKDANRPFQTDSSKVGYFTGTLSDSLFHKLTVEFNRANPKSLKFPKVMCCDAPVVTLILYYKGKRKFLKSMTPPPEARELIAVLRGICESTTQRSPDKFVIENPK